MALRYFNFMKILILYFYATHGQYIIQQVYKSEFGPFCFTLYGNISTGTVLCYISGFLSTLFTKFQMKFFDVMYVKVSSSHLSCLPEVPGLLEDSMASLHDARAIHCH